MAKNDDQQQIPVSTHWGNYLMSNNQGKLLVDTYDRDIDVTLLRYSLTDFHNKNWRIDKPVVRRSYLEKGAGTNNHLRGKEKFVEVSWQQAIDLAAKALKETISEQGNEAIYGGSYGWASAGRFHHAQSQVHRFLNLLGGYTSSVNTYSSAAAEVILSNIIGGSYLSLFVESPTPEEIAENCQILVCFGGIPARNSQISNGGLGGHNGITKLNKLGNSDVEIVNVSPIKDDLTGAFSVNWWPARPNTDVAIMLGIAHWLINNDGIDEHYLTQYTSGYEKFAEYVLGKTDGVEKTPQWASELSEISAQDICSLAKKLATQKSLITVSLSIQRTEHGEQSYWMATTLAAMLGHIGKKGCGIGFGYGAMHNFGFNNRMKIPFSIASFKQGKNPIKRYIPVSRITEMLEQPGETIDYNGKKITYPKVELIYWAGGNPYHHHQDLFRLEKAWQKPKHIIVHESAWTATARRADIVFPISTSIERSDFSGSSMDDTLSPMKPVIDAFGQSKTDYWVLSQLAKELGIAESFTESKSELEWVEHLYEQTRGNAKAKGVDLPEFSAFWQGNQISIKDSLVANHHTLEKFRESPETAPLKTPSGKLEIYSESIASYQYHDCLGHAAWFEKKEYLGSEQAKRFSFHLISNQPKTRLHSQLDQATVSKNSKIKQREPMRINSKMAIEQGLKNHDIVKLFNQRGSCLAAVIISEDIRDNVVELATGAWFDACEDNNNLELHGNPNAVTCDQGTSSLAQGPSAHSCLVALEKWQGTLPNIKVNKPPAICKS